MPSQWSSGLIPGPSGEAKAFSTVLEKGVFKLVSPAVFVPSSFQYGLSAFKLNAFHLTRFK